MAARSAMEIAKFDEIDDSWVHAGGIWTRCVFVGDHNSPDAPVGVAIKADCDVGDLVAGKKSFGTTTMTTVLSGTVMHDGRWLKRGDIYVSPPGEMSGDLLFGPEGAVIFIMFDSRSGMIPSFADPRDQARFDAEYRRDVEAVAEGRCEKSVVILPPRDEPTVGRAIAFHSQAEVARYREEMGTDW